jgi:hypothetical protein
MQNFPVYYTVYRLILNDYNNFVYFFFLNCVHRGSIYIQEYKTNSLNLQCGALLYTLTFVKFFDIKLN